MELLSTMFAPPRRPRAMFAHDHPADNPPALADLAAQLASYVRDAAAAGTPAPRLQPPSPWLLRPGSGPATSGTRPPPAPRPPGRTRPLATPPGPRPRRPDALLRPARHRRRWPNRDSRRRPHLRAPPRAAR